jgi:hypothetical protein
MPWWRGGWWNRCVTRFASKTSDGFAWAVNGIDFKFVAGADGASLNGERRAVNNGQEIVSRIVFNRVN